MKPWHHWLPDFYTIGGAIFLIATDITIAHIAGVHP